jgi:hypothetical protein
MEGFFLVLPSCLIEANSIGVAAFLAQSETGVLARGKLCAYVFGQLFDNEVCGSFAKQIGQGCFELPVRVTVPRV